MQLTQELLGRLDSYRSREGRSRSDVIREAVERYLADDHEAELDRQIVADTTANLLTTPGATRRHSG